MLVFKQAVQNPDGSTTLYVFSDEEKGHTVYLSQTGQLVVMETEQRISSKTRAAGFAISSSSGCTDCDGC